MTVRRPLPNLEDPDYPAYSMGAAAELLQVEPAFLRGLGQHGLLTPHRSPGGHRRFSHNDLLIAARAREVVDEGAPLAAACRIVQLERELAAARATIAELRRRLGELEEEPTD